MANRQSRDRHIALWHPQATSAQVCLVVGICSLSRSMSSSDSDGGSSVAKPSVCNVGHKSERAKVAADVSTFIEKLDQILLSITGDAHWARLLTDPGDKPIGKVLHFQFSVAPPFTKLVVHTNLYLTHKQ